MSSRKEEERNEKIIRGLLKLPPNRRCINCNSLGPQYVCTNFWTFICIACSGIHREFTHRVKSVSMAKFTTQEVEALQRGGNQRAREQFLKDWDTERLRLPANSNPDKIREFIKSVYVDKKYAAGRSSDKPPRETQSLKGHEEDHRRASSYHSFSQSPPYDHQYEERRYGKQAGMLTRKPGSDRGHYYEGKVSSFMYSTGHQGEQMYEDSFANEGSNPRMSDFLVSSTGDPSRSGVQSPSTNDPRYSSPPQVKDIFVEDTLPKKMNTSSESLVKGETDKIPHPHRTASSGSFGSFDSNSMSFKSGNSGSLTDAVLEPEHTAGVQQTGPSTFPSLPQISSAHATNQDLFGPSFLEPPTSNFASSIDLFSDSSQLPSLTNPSEQKPQVTPSSENEGWATFDFPPQVRDTFVEDTLPKKLNTSSESLVKGDTDKIPHPHRTASSGSFGSFDSNSLSSKSGNSGSLTDAVLEPEHTAGVQQTGPSTFPSLLQISSAHATNQDLFGPSFLEPPTSNFASSIDLFSDSSQLPSLTNPSEQKPQVTPSSEIEGWATFDFPHHVGPSFEASKCLPSLMPPSEGTITGKLDVFSSMHNNSGWFSVQSSTDHGQSFLMGDQWHVGSNEVKDFVESRNAQGGTNIERKSMNPFDLPNDLNPEVNSLFMDVSSLQEALPDKQPPNTFLAGLPDPWFLVPSVPQGGLAHIGGHVPSSQLPNILTNDPVAPLGGNPFA